MFDELLEKTTIIADAVITLKENNMFKEADELIKKTVTIKDLDVLICMVKEFLEIDI